MWAVCARECISPTTAHMADYICHEVHYVERMLTPLMAACYDQDREAVQRLLQGGADPNHGIDGELPLTTSGPEMNGMGYDVGIVRMLVEAGADVNATNARGISALSVACICGEVDSARYLLECGADPYAEDINGFTPEDHSLHFYDIDDDGEAEITILIREYCIPEKHA